MSAWRENSLRRRFAYNYVCYITNCILGEILMFLVRGGGGDGYRGAGRNSR